MQIVPRIESQKDAAAMLRITPRRLREMETSSPWWVADMRTEEGYDVVGIAVGQLSFSTDANESLPAAEKDALKARGLRAETLRAEFMAQEAEVKAWRAQKQKETEQGNILPADVFAQFVRELLGMLRSRLDDLPFQLSRQASASQKPLIYVPEHKQKKAVNAAPLQKMIAKLLGDVEEWLATDPTKDDES
jgi:hypothetical protein